MTEQQELLMIRDAIRGGRTPRMAAPLSADFARRLTRYRETVDGRVDVLASLPDKLIVLVEPTDGRALYLWQFEALTFAGDDGARQ